MTMLFKSLLHLVLVAMLVFVVTAAVERAAPNCAHVVGATATLAASGDTWTFLATISSPYEVGWDQYADTWQVRIKSGDTGVVLGTRSLAHPHETERLFTRSLTGVAIGQGISSVVFTAHDSVEGYCGEEFTLQLPRQAQGGYCFSGTSTVQVKKWNDVQRSELLQQLPMNSLKLGDLIHVGHDKYERVYSFGHYSPFAIASFLQIETSADSDGDASAASMMQLSPSHMVFTTQSYNVAVAASKLRVGDEVLMGRNNRNGTDAATVTKISTVTSQGLFAPFTPSGTLVVNGVLVSSYIAMMGSTTTALLASSWLLHHQHWLAHSFQFPHRLACHYYYYERGGSRRGCGIDETYTPEGLSTWVATPHSMAKRVMKLHPLLLDILLSLLAVGMWLFNVVELLLIKSNLYKMIR